MNRVNAGLEEGTDDGMIRRWMGRNINTNTFLIILGLAALTLGSKYFVTLGDHEKDLRPLNALPPQVSANRDETIRLSSRMEALERAYTTQQARSDEILRQLSEIRQQQAAGNEIQKSNAERLRRIEGRLDK